LYTEGGLQELPVKTAILLPNELDEQISLSFNVTYCSLPGVNNIVDIK